VSEPYLSGDEVLNLTKYSQDALNELLSNLDLLNSIFFDHNGTVLIHYNGSKVCRNYFNYTPARDYILEVSYIKPVTVAEYLVNRTHADTNSTLVITLTRIIRELWSAR